MKSHTTRRFWESAIAILIAAFLIAMPFLSTMGSSLVHAEMDGPGNYMSDYSNMQETLAAENELNQKMADESFVLLKNKDGYLPIPTTSKIVLMGRGVEDAAAGGSGSGATSVSVRITNALQNAGFSNISSVFTNQSNGISNGNVSAQRTNTVAPQMNDDRRQTIQNADVAIVVFSRTSGENIGTANGTYADQAVTGISSTHGHILALDANEKQILAYANQYCENVILVINASNAMELPELKDETTYPNLKAGIWVGGVGANGYNAFGRILKGEVNPSGHLPDSYVNDLTKDPTWFNWGTNAQVQGAANFQYRVNGSNSGRWGQYYEEGIYLGYKYYETRAHDYDPDHPITRIGEVAYKDGEEWFQNTVTFPFGFGLSYTTFDWEVLSSGTTAEDAPLNADSKLEVTVKVTNTGKVAGKDVVQLYYTAPYTKGGIEKSYKSLGDFEKTRLIEPGKSDVVKLHISLREMASYDYDDKNKNDFKGYEADKGDYVLHISSDSHVVKSTLTYNLAENVKYTTDEKTGSTVENRCDDVSNDFKARATEFSRNDLVGTFPAAPTTAEMTIDADYQELMNKNSWNYNTSFNAAANSTNVNAKRFSDNNPNSPWYIGGASAEMPATNVTPNSGIIMLKDMVGVPLKHRKWNQFISQLSVSEMYNLIRQGGYQTIAISRLGVPATTDQDGPQALNNRGGNVVAWVAPVNTAATWNKEMCYLQGRGLGNEALWKNVECWYAPAVNTHRSAFGGRNFEYYSEDAILAGKIAAEVTRGCTEKGLIVTVKHFALNEMETTRTAVCVFATEQAMREIYLRAFELPVKAGALGIMSSMNNVGTNWAGGYYAIGTEILRNEWGFAGFVVTDYGAGNMDYGIRGCSDLSLNSGAPTQTNPSATQVYYMQQASKHILYAVANSMAMNTRTSQINNAFPAKAYRVPELKYEDQTINALPNEEMMARVNVFSDLGKNITYALDSGSTLPAGLTLSTDGVISGTPTQSGTYRVTVNASGDSSVVGAKATHTINVTSGRIEYEPKTLGTAKVGVAYSDNVASAVGGTFTYALAQGAALPAGLSLAADGTITGTPTAVGSTTFKVVATSGETVLDRDFTLTVVGADATISYDLTVKSAKVGYNYSLDVATATGASNVSYEIVGNLPAGLSFVNNSITGTPTTAGTYNFSIKAKAAGFDDVTLPVTLKVAAQDAVITFAGKALGSVSYGSAANVDIDVAEGADGIAYTLKDGSALPVGLRIENGKIVGTPAEVGDFTFTLVANADNYTPVEAEFTLKVEKGTFNYNGGKLEDGTVLVTYRQSIALSENVPGATYSLKEGSALPAGLSIYASGNTVNIQGTPTEAGDYTFTIVLSAEGYESAEATFTLKVAKAKKGGCGGVIGAGSVALIALVGVAAVALRKKEN